VRTLWREYWEALPLPPDLQNFSTELESLPGPYVPPRGCLLLVRVEGEPVGTAAFRPLRGDACEAKRLYVRHQFRNQGLGRALLERLIEEARAAGYREIYGDTLKSMLPALAMYRQFGFAEVPPYSLDPTPGAVYLRLGL
jgi:putative acetyltransferase